MQTSVEHYHHKYGQCEQCGISIEECGPLTILEFWKEDFGNSLYYLHVCEGCYTSRSKWCKNLFPDSCDWCKKVIEEGDACEVSKLGNEYSNKRSIICYSDKKMHSKNLKLTSLRSAGRRKKHGAL